MPNKHRLLELYRLSNIGSRNVFIEWTWGFLGYRKNFFMPVTSGNTRRIPHAMPVLFSSTPAIIRTSIEVKAWMSNYWHGKPWGAITHSCLNINDGGLLNPCWNWEVLCIIPNGKLWIGLLIHAVFLSGFVKVVFSIQFVTYSVSVLTVYYCVFVCKILAIFVLW